MAELLQAELGHQLSGSEGRKTLQRNGKAQVTNMESCFHEIRKFLPKSTLS